MKRKFSIVASSTMGLESIVKEECKKIGVFKYTSMEWESGI